MPTIRKLLRYGKGEPVTFRCPETIEELAQYCQSRTHIEFLSNKNTAVNVKVNGNVRRWKRDPLRIEIPIKYGLYEYQTITRHDITRVLIPVEGE